MCYAIEKTVLEDLKMYGLKAYPSLSETAMLNNMLKSIECNLEKDGFNYKDPNFIVVATKYRNVNDLKVINRHKDLIIITDYADQLV